MKKALLQNKLKLAFISLTVLLFHSAIHAQFTVGGGVGYGLGLGGGLINGDNSTTTTQNGAFISSTSMSNGVYGTWGQGFNINALADYPVCPHVAVGLEANYLFGKTFTATSTQTNINNTLGTTSTSMDVYQGNYNGFRASPFISIQSDPCDNFTPYARVGLQMNLLGMMKQTETDTQTGGSSPGVTVEKSSLTGKISLGLNTALGVDYKLSDSWKLYGEMFYNNSSFKENKWTLNQYTINGANELSTLPTSEKQTDYVKSFTSNGTPNPDSPSQSLMSPMPLGSFGLNIGLKYTFGSLEKK